MLPHLSSCPEYQTKNETVDKKLFYWILHLHETRKNVKMVFDHHFSNSLINNYLLFITMEMVWIMFPHNINSLRDCTKHRKEIFISYLSG